MGTWRWQRTLAVLLTTRPSPPWRTVVMRLRSQQTSSITTQRLPSPPRLWSKFFLAFGGVGNYFAFRSVVFQYNFQIFHSAFCCHIVCCDFILPCSVRSSS